MRRSQPQQQGAAQPRERRGKKHAPKGTAQRGRRGVCASSCIVIARHCALFVAYPSPLCAVHPSRFLVAREGRTGQDRAGSKARQGRGRRAEEQRAGVGTDRACCLCAVCAALQDGCFVCCCCCCVEWRGSAAVQADDRCACRDGDLSVALRFCSPVPQTRLRRRRGTTAAVLFPSLPTHAMSKVRNPPSCS